MKSLRRHASVWKTAFVQFIVNDGMTAAGNMAFLAMLSLFPFIIFLVAISGTLGQTETGIEAINFMMSVLPPEVGTVLQGPINGIIKSTGAEILTGSILFAIWTAANGVECARGVLLKAFGWEHAHAIWIRRLESLAVVIFGAITIIIAMSILIIGPALFKAATNLFPDAMTDGISGLWHYINFMLSPAVLLLGLYGIFLALTPRSVNNPSRLPGTLLTLTILFVAAKGLSFYLSYADNYDVTYGSLAGVVITQIFCFVVSMGFVLGAELNAAYSKSRQEQKSVETKSIPA
ncbi:hypothetical protein GCM10017044_22120 [Kordiimonas sediminis]|uniref:YihY/virulence factor BrkB family protein n=1 Tax=Kordiimonas sediminis TaxID=1735581 RepID=A0A919AVE1_9PROT|nr:YihY/virulence factor BrkB family protein [Kordiimonas sediminis]GHF26686.1 hypothetical protein GCM10017044_22120 [Kordiimonas sediminis]